VGGSYSTRPPEPVDSVEIDGKAFPLWRRADLTMARAELLSEAIDRLRAAEKEDGGGFRITRHPDVVDVVLRAAIPTLPSGTTFKNMGYEAADKLFREVLSALSRDPPAAPLRPSEPGRERSAKAASIGMPSGHGSRPAMAGAMAP